MKKQMIICVLCILTSLAGYKSIPNDLLADKYPVSLENTIPTNIPGWRQVNTEQGDSITSPELSEKLASIYSQIVTRRYVSSDGYQVMLSVAYTKDQSDNTGQQSHRPEICYPAQGFDVVKNNKAILASHNIPLEQFIAVNQDRYEAVTYFMTIGNKVVNSNIDIKVAQVKYSLDGYIPDGVIFRVSSINRDAETAFGIQQKFIGALLDAAPSAASRILPISENK